MMKKKQFGVRRSVDDLKQLEIIAEQNNCDSVNELINLIMDDLILGNNFNQTIKRVHLEIQPVVENQRLLNESLEELIKQNLIWQEKQTDLLAEIFSDLNTTLNVLMQAMLKEEGD